MRTIWNGSISFGLVNIPIGLALATQRQDVSFRTLHRECGTPIKQKRWCPRPRARGRGRRARQGLGVGEGPVRPRRGLRSRGGRPQRSQSIEILRFVQLEDVDPSTSTAPTTCRRPRRGAAQAVRPPAPRDGGVRHGRRREVRALGEGEPLSHPAQGGALVLETLSSPTTCARRRRSRRPSGRPRCRRPSSQLAGQVIESLVGRVGRRGLRERVPPATQRMLEAKLAGEAITRRSPSPRRRCRPDGGAAPQRRRGAGPPRRRERTPRTGKPPRRERLSRSREAPARKSA